ncbi:hypothetical protein F2P81_011365 [Scophthalmus maximus]|uniref:Uncharacterized protein n=1 Tax=Scophthalmus maximus TaxID=52904 RepID=A0A6A4SPY0_SCOMX|nr:hypothetical protein F2P81_011365 [Scophthalmus maximus]
MQALTEDTLTRSMDQQMDGQRCECVYHTGESVNMQCTSSALSGIIGCSLFLAGENISHIEYGSSDYRPGTLHQILTYQQFGVKGEQIETSIPKAAVAH